MVPSDFESVHRFPPLAHFSLQLPLFVCFNLFILPLMPCYSGPRCFDFPLLTLPASLCKLISFAWGRSKNVNLNGNWWEFWFYVVSPLCRSFGQWMVVLKMKSQTFIKALSPLKLQTKQKKSSHFGTSGPAFLPFPTVMQHYPLDLHAVCAFMKLKS